MSIAQQPKTDIKNVEMKRVKLVTVASRISRDFTHSTLNTRAVEIQVTAMQRLCMSCAVTIATSSRCGKCREIYYCCRQCQQSDWPIHKLECDTGVVKREAPTRWIFRGVSEHARLDPAQFLVTDSKAVVDSFRAPPGVPPPILNLIAQSNMISSSTLASATTATAIATVQGEAQVSSTTATTPVACGAHLGSRTALAVTSTATAGSVLSNALDEKSEAFGANANGSTESVRRFFQLDRANSCDTLTSILLNLVEYTLAASSAVRLTVDDRDVTKVAIAAVPLLGFENPVLSYVDPLTEKAHEEKSLLELDKRTSASVHKVLIVHTDDTHRYVVDLSACQYATTPMSVGTNGFPCVLEQLIEHAAPIPKELLPFRRSYLPYEIQTPSESSLRFCDADERRKFALASLPSKWHAQMEQYHRETLLFEQSLYTLAVAMLA